MLAPEYPVALACELLDCPRSSYYYQPGEASDEPELRKEIKATAAEWPTYGYRRITKQLRLRWESAQPALDATAPIGAWDRRRAGVRKS